MNIEATFAPSRPFTLLTIKFVPSREEFLGSFLRFAQSSDSRKFALFASFAAYLPSSALSAFSALLTFEFFSACDEFSRAAKGVCGL